MSITLNQVTGSVLSNILTYMRRIIKSASTQSITDLTLADYVNRFYNYDAPARLQLFEMKRQYIFETIPNIFQYQAPFYNFSPNVVEPVISTGMPMYQMFEPPIYCDGVQMGWYQDNTQFYNVFPEFVNNETPFQGTNSIGPYFTMASATPILRAFIDDLGNLQPYVFISAIDNTGAMNYIVDSGFLNADGLGILVQTDPTFQIVIGMPIVDGGAGTIDYNSGAASFTFLSDIPSTSNIQILTSPFSAGFPRICLFFNNFFKLYPVPDRVYKIQVDAFVTPSQFLQTNSAVPFAYMSDWIALGAARRILIDNESIEQLAFYEPYFREQESLVLRRTDRQKSTIRTPTIFSASTSQYPYFYTQY
jgi:hypothetical protein